MFAPAIVWMVAGFLGVASPGGGGGVGGGAWTSSDQPTSPAQPAALPEPAELASLSIVDADREHFGQVRVGVRIQRIVTFESRLGVPVELKVLEKTSGCIEARFEHPIVQPGERTVLTIVAQVNPAMGVQAQSVVFSASWREGEEARSERGTSAITFRPDVALVARPESIGIVAIAGQRARADVFIRSMEDAAEFSFGPAECELPGWTLRRVEDDPPLPGGVARFRAEGPAGAAGTHDGKLVWRAQPGEEPFLRVPIRVRAVHPYGVVPGGAIFAYSEGQERRRVDLRLIPNSGRGAGGGGAGARGGDGGGGLPAQYSVRLIGGGPWLRAEANGGGGITVELSPVSGMPPHGAARVEVTGPDGSTLVNFPVVWYRLERDE